MERPTFHNEPPADFAKPEARAAFEKALQEARLGFAALSGSRNVTGQDRSARDAHEAVVRAKAAFSNWKRTTAEERAALLFRAAAAFRKRRMEFAAWLLLEVGKGPAEADAEVCEAIDFLEYYGREALKLAAQAPLAKPLGVVAVIAPWNFPLAIPAGMTAAALVTGNTVVMKPAEQSSVIGRLLFDLLLEAGVPEGVLNFLPGSGETVGDALARHQDVNLVCFTGSKEVGHEIARRKRRTIAETGGKNAIIVDETADLDVAAEQARLSAFGFQGQKCSACSRIILLPKVYEPFKERFLAAVSKIRVGDPADFSNFMGPVIDEEAQARIMRAIEASETDFTLIHRGEAPWKDRYVGPAVFENVPPMSRLAQREIFGPVVILMKARDVPEAVEIANEVPYDLTGGFFSGDRSVIERVKTKFEVGNLYINRKITGALVACQPFGGYRLSSLGFKAGGPEYLWQFVTAGKPLQPPLVRDLPSASFQREDRNQLVYIKEGHRLLGRTICERLTM